VTTSVPHVFTETLLAVHVIATHLVGVGRKGFAVALADLRREVELKLFVVEKLTATPAVPVLYKPGTATTVV
jgi:hypothetical protein